jgi:MFS family permease
LRSPAPRALLATASVAVALAAADTYVVVLALTDMMRGVGVGIDALQRATPIVSGFLLGYVAVLPLVGRLADLVDRQRVLLGCLLVFVLGSAVTALAVELPVLVTGRVLQGMGGGGLVPATLALVADLWPPGRRGLPLGVVGAVQELGSVLGPVLGALVLVVADWRWIFWLGAGLGLLLAALVVLAGGGRVRRPRTTPLVLGLLALAAGWLALAAPEALTTSVALGLPFVPFGGSTSRWATPIGVAALGLAVVSVATATRGHLRVLRRVDAPGALLLGGALGCVVVSFAAARPEREVVGPLGYALLPVAALLAVASLVHHRRAAEPLVPRGLVGSRMWRALATSLLVGVALVAVVVDVPLLARIVQSADETSAALVLVRFLVAVPVGALAGGWAVRRAGDGPVAAAGLALATAGLAVMSTWGVGSLEEVSATVVLATTGLGVGLAIAPVNDAALAASDEASHGTASALVVVARMVGMVVGLALLTGIGLHRYYEAVAALPGPVDTAALRDAAVVQVSSVLRGAALAAGAGTLVAATLGRRPGATTGTERRKALAEA